jgi:hypothetical protein
VGQDRFYLGAAPSIRQGGLDGSAVLVGDRVLPGRHTPWTRVHGEVPRVGDVDGVLVQHGDMVADGTEPGGPTRRSLTERVTRAAASMSRYLEAGAR